MGILTNPYTIATLITLALALTIYCFVVPQSKETYSPKIDQNNLAMKALAGFGSDLFMVLPGFMQIRLKNVTSERLERLVTQSGNPWRLTPTDFFFFQFVTAIIGLIVGFALSFLVSGLVSIPWWIVMIGGGILGFMLPSMAYSDLAKKRDIEFKRELPEALDLIKMSLRGGKTLQAAIRESLPNMKDSILKDEFTEMIKAVDTGRTMDSAWESFATRVPNDSIKTFVQAVREANTLNVPMVDVFTQRAKASREEYIAMIADKTASLSSKMSMASIPTFIPALLIVALAPSIVAMIQGF